MRRILVGLQGRPIVACSAHGLRKAGATRAAERGASERQLMAIFGWSTGKMAQHYTRTADRARLAQAAAEFLLPDSSSALKEDDGKGSKPRSEKAAQKKNEAAN